jgi:hypothetical protein
VRGWSLKAAARQQQQPPIVPGLPALLQPCKKIKKSYSLQSMIYKHRPTSKPKRPINKQVNKTAPAATNSRHHHRMKNR